MLLLYGLSAQSSKACNEAGRTACMQHFDRPPEKIENLASKLSVRSVTQTSLEVRFSRPVDNHILSFLIHILHRIALSKF
jgi:hypothetical protein